MTTLLIARHGNTFDAGDTVVRVGLKTDLPLSNSGKLQAQKLGTFLHDNNIQPVIVYTSLLQRTIETAEIALKTANIQTQIQPDPIFNEIDYGPDEAKTEDEVKQRIGVDGLLAWDTNAIVPPGWLANPQVIINNWINFAQQISTEYPDQTVLVVTSNGIARFAPYLTGDFAGFSRKHNIKLSTGALCSLTIHNSNWHIEYWNKKIT